jgi:hypothetical protein
MKKIIFTSLFVAMTLLAGNAMAETQTKVVNFAWDMANAPSDIAGFNIYLDNKIVATYNGLDGKYSSTMTIDSENACFALTAFDKAYVSAVTNKEIHESGKTAPVCINLPPNTPTSFKVSIEAIVTITDRTMEPKAATKSMKK